MGCLNMKEYIIGYAYEICENYIKKYEVIKGDNIRIEFLSS